MCTKQGMYGSHLHKCVCVREREREREREGEFKYKSSDVYIICMHAQYGMFAYNSNADTAPNNGQYWISVSLIVCACM